MIVFRYFSYVSKIGKKGMADGVSAIIKSKGVQKCPINPYLLAFLTSAHLGMSNPIYCYPRVWWG